MIVSFDFVIDALGLVHRLMDLPSEIRPVFFSTGEKKGSKNNLVSIERKLIEFITNNKLGFFLHSQNGTLFNISIHSDSSSIRMYCEDGYSSEVVESIFFNISKENPLFGYACDDEEYKHRNRYFITIDKAHIEGWVGRKLDKYISGIYWYTLFSTRLLEKHNLDLSSLCDFEKISNDDSMVLIKLYQNMAEWEANASYIDDICEKTEGVFSRRPVELALDGVTNFIEYHNIIKEWG